MTNTTVITALGKEIGAEPGISFDNFRKVATRFHERHSNGAAGNPVERTLVTLSKIITETKSHAYDDQKDAPWESVVHRVLFGEMKNRRTGPARDTTTEKTSEFFEQEARRNAKNDLQKHIHSYTSALTEGKAAFQRNSMTGLANKKRAITKDLHDYRTGLNRLHAFAQAFAAKQAEISEATTPREATPRKNTSDVQTLSARYEVFLKDHAPVISTHIKALDDNAIVAETLRLYKGSVGGRINYLFMGENDEQLRENLLELKTQLDNIVKTGFASSLNPRVIQKNSLVIKGKASVDNLLDALDKQQTAQGVGIMSLHASFGKLHSSEVNMAIWDACFGVASAQRVRDALGQMVAPAPSLRRPETSQRPSTDINNFFIDQSFTNDYSRLDGFTEEQKRLFADLDYIATTQPENMHGVRSGVNYTVNVNKSTLDNIIPAIQNTALEEAERNYDKLDRTSQERIQTMSVGSCPFTAFENSNRAFIDEVVAHMNAVNTPSMSSAAYLKQAQKFHEELRAKIKEMSLIDSGNRGPVAPPRSSVSVRVSAPVAAL